MSIIWTPPGPTLFTRAESDTGISYSVVVISDQEALGYHAVIVGYTVTPNELPPQVIISFLDNTLTVTATDLNGSYPMTLDYLQNKVYGQSTSFNLPTGKMDIYKYWRSTDSPRIFNLAITATDTVVTETRTYQMIVTPDYSAGRDRLLVELDARD